MGEYTITPYTSPGGFVTYTLKPAGGDYPRIGVVSAVFAEFVKRVESLERDVAALKSR